MYFSLIRLQRGLSPRNVAVLGLCDGYQMHKLIWDLFSDAPDRRRDFLYRFEKTQGLPTFYAISKREPVDTLALWDIQTKPFAPRLKDGDRLSFSVRINPIRSKRDENGRQHRHDVVMEAKIKIGFKNLAGDQRPLIANLVQQAGVDWLKSRENEYGFTVDGVEDRPQVRADGYSQHRFFKGKGKPPITFSTLEFNGVLTVNDQEKFVNKCLYEGLGPAKGFGCGLMLVKRL